MQWITVATPPFASIEQFERVLAEQGEEPAGLEARYVGTAGGELRVVTLWESRAHADRFFAEKLGPALTKCPGSRTGGHTGGHRHRGGPRLRPPAGRLNHDRLSFGTGDHRFGRSPVPRPDTV